MSEEKLIRKRLWYRRFKKLIKKVHEDIYEDWLEYIHDLLDECRGFHSQTISDKAYEAMGLALKDFREELDK